MRTSIWGVVALTFSVVFSPATSTEAVAKGTAKKAYKPQAQTASYATTDQVITKNPDGTVEVSDGPGSAPAGETGDGASAAASAAPSRQVIYKVAGPGTTKYADGTVVTRNADGSVEVSDSDSVSPKIHWNTPRPAVRHAAARHSTKSAKRH